MIAYGMVLVIVMWLNHSIPGLKLKQSVQRFFAKLLHRNVAVEEEV